MASAVATTKTFQREVEGMSVRNRQAFTTLGLGMAGFGALVVGGFGVAAKAAMDFESSFAGVRKTVDASEGQFARMAEELRDLAPEIGTNVNELNAIAEGAGQLGIQRPNIVGFTETVAKLRETTDLVDAAPLARLMNIMQTSQGEIDRLGSSVVALGNDGASTESEIVDMALGIAGAGKVVGASEADVLALANALSSVGIEAEAGGSSTSRALIEMAEAVDDGGEKLRTFADVAGLSTEEFSRAFEEDAAGALVSFIEGLGRVDESGGSVFKTLDSLGLSEIRVRRALLGMAGAGDLLRKSLDLGARAWEENTALQDEFAKRMETAEKKIDRAQAQVGDMAISVGSFFLPAIGNAAEAVTEFLQSIENLPGPLKAAAAGLAGVLGVAGLLGGAVILLAPQILAAKKALEDFGITSARMRTTLGLFGKSLTVIGAGFVAFEQGSRLLENIEKEGIWEGLKRQMLENLATFERWTGGAIGRGAQAELDKITPKVKDLGSAVREGSKVTDGWAGAFQSGSASLEEFGDGQADTAAEVEAHNAELREQRNLLLQLAGGFSGLIATFRAQRDAEKELIDARRDLNRLTEEGRQGTKKYREAQERYEAAQLAALDSVIASRQAIKDYAKELTDSGKSQRQVNDRIRELGKEAGLSKREINDLIGEVRDYREDVDKVKDKKPTKFTAPGLDDVHRKVKELLDFFSRMPGGLAIQADIRGSAGAGPALAMAGTSMGAASKAAAIVPGIQTMTSGYRPGDTGSYHSIAPPFNATDWAGENLSQMYNLLKATNPTEMILDHSIFQKGVEGYYAPSDHMGSNRHLHYYLEHGGFFEKPTTGFMTMAEKSPEVVSPVPVLRQIVGESQAPIIVKISPRGGLGEIIDVHVERAMDGARSFDDSRNRAMSR